MNNKNESCYFQNFVFYYAACTLLQLRLWLHLLYRAHHSVPWILGICVYQHLLYLKNKMLGTSLEIQWLRLCTSTAGGTGSIPDGGTKIPYAAWHGQGEKKKKISCLRAVTESVSVSALLSPPPPLLLSHLPLYSHPPPASGTVPITYQMYNIC